MHSGEYYYDKKHHQWFDVEYNPNIWIQCSAEDCKLEPELVKSLRNAKKTGKFIIIPNKYGQKYPRIIADFIYMDTSALRFLLHSQSKNGTEIINGFWYTETDYGYSTHFIHLNLAINKEKVLKLFIPEYSKLVEYVEDVDYYGCNTKEEKMNLRQHHFNMLDDAAKLYYQLEGNYNFI